MAAFKGEKNKFQSKENANNEKKEAEQFKIWNGKKFYYIVGYTSGGAPYGITWEEYEKDIKEDTEDTFDEENNKGGTFLDGDLPF